MKKLSAHSINVLSRASKGNLRISKAADLLGVSRKTIYVWLKQYKDRIESFSLTEAKSKKTDI